MESEKVKEIKKALEHCAEEITCKGCPEYNNEPVIDWFKCKKTLAKKTIALINELESENERLKQLREVDYKTITTLRQANTELNECMDEMQDRIAELEKENINVEI